MTQTEFLNWLDSGGIYRNPAGDVWLYHGELKPTSMQNSADLSSSVAYFRDFYSIQAFVMTGNFEKISSGSRVLLDWIKGTEKGLTELTLTRKDFQKPEREQYEKTFQSIMSMIEAGRLKKALPVMFEEANSLPNRICKLRWLRRLLENSSAQHLYGVWNEQTGALGLSPEILFSIDSGRLKTMALAGTMPKEDRNQRLPLLQDPKELLEHQFVVDDIKERLADHGKLSVAKTEEVELPHLFHLRTEISLDITHGDLTSIQDWVNRLHPTSALGAYPRQNNFDWLRALPGQHERGLFGSPMTFRLAENAWTSVVAIRGIFWESKKTRVGSGGGLVRGSILEQEWSELSSKRDSVFSNLGIC